MEVQQTVDEVIEKVKLFVDDGDAEVQERVRYFWSSTREVIADDPETTQAVTFHQLLQFIRADLHKLPSTPSTSDSSPFTSDPTYPKSLRLISPLSSTFQMAAVAPEAQSRVKVPDGLDLDLAIVPPSIAFPDLEVKKEKKKGKKKKKDVGEGEAGPSGLKVRRPGM